MFKETVAHSILVSHFSVINSPKKYSWSYRNLCHNKPITFTGSLADDIFNWTIENLTKAKLQALLWRNHSYLQVFYNKILKILFKFFAIFTQRF